MKVLIRFLIVTFLVMVHGEYKSMDFIPMDLLGSLAPEKKLHNKIASSVSGSVKKPNIIHKVTDSVSEDKLKKSDQDHTDKDESKVSKIPVAPKSVPETHEIHKKAIIPSKTAEKEVSVNKEKKDIDDSAAHKEDTDKDHDTKQSADHFKKMAANKEVDHTTAAKKDHTIDHDLKHLADHVKNITEHKKIDNKDIKKEDHTTDHVKKITGHKEIDHKEIEKKDHTIEHDLKHLSEHVKKVTADTEADHIIVYKEDHTIDHDEKTQEKEERVTVKPVFEKGVLYQDSGFVDDSETVVFNFEETDLLNVANYMETIHHIKFVSEDILSNVKDAKGLAGHKVTFRTNKVLTKKESWDLFLTFLHIAGLDVVPMAQVGFYKIVPFVKANSDTIPTYIGVDAMQLPDNDMIVRYVYFAQSIEPSKIVPILTKMQAGSAKLEQFTELKALIFTDRACNIKSLMQIVKELDKSALPETLSVVKLQRANVDDVISLYKSLKPQGTTQQPQRAWVPGRKEATLEYFPQDVATVGDKRTNSLILIGPEKGVRRIEEFVEKYIDAPAERETPEIFIYTLQYTNSDTIQQTLKSIVEYGSSTSAGQAGGVRDDIKYFGKMTIVSEKQTNSLIINASKEDYEMLKPLIDELDVPQKQIGIEVLIVTVSDGNSKSFGSQLSAPNGPYAPTDGQKKCQTFGQSIAAQTSALSGNVVTTTGGTTTNSPDYSIKSSLASLLGNIGEVGSLFVTFGQPIWSVFKILNTIQSTHVIANPFLTVSNNTKANFTIGTTRNIATSTQFSGGNSGQTLQGFKQKDATLKVDITPQINKGNIINLDINVQDESFVFSGPENENSALTDNKNISTTASVANGEVLVLGGIMTERYTSSSNGVPFLENIPLLGWFFKSKNKTLNREHFLIFICPKLLESVDEQKTVGDFTRRKMIEAQNSIETIDEVNWFTEKKDPIQRAFFKEDTTMKLRMFGGKNQGVTSKVRKKKDKKQVVKKVSSKDVRKKRLKEYQQSKNNKQLYIKPLSFDNDFVQTQEPVSQSVNSISRVIGQEDRLHV